MAINDLLGRVLRPLGLMAAVSGCGGEDKANLYSPCDNSVNSCSSIESNNSDRGICLISPYGPGQPSFCSFPCYVSVRPSELSESIEKLRGTCTTDAHGCDYSGMDERETPPGCCYMANPSALPKSFGGGWIGGGYCLPYPPGQERADEGNNYSVEDACRNLAACDEPYRHEWMKDFNTCTDLLDGKPYPQGYENYPDQGLQDQCMINCFATKCVEVLEDYCGCVCFPETACKPGN